MLTSTDDFCTGNCWSLHFSSRNFTTFQHGECKYISFYVWPISTKSTRYLLPRSYLTIVFVCIHIKLDKFTYMSSFYRVCTRCFTVELFFSVVKSVLNHGRDIQSCPKSRLDRYFLSSCFSFSYLCVADLFTYCIVSFYRLFYISKLRGGRDGGSRGGGPSKLRHLSKFMHK